MLQQITPLILTYNEAPNIERTLEQLLWAPDIVVVDSFSNDATVEIASDFPKVRVVQRRFDTHENQWNFGLKKTGIETDWVLALDADYFLTPAGTAELERLSPGLDISGYRGSFIYCVNGQRLAGGIYPPVIVLYRRDLARYCQDGHTQKLIIEGRIESLASPLLHDDRKSLKRWFQSQALYTKLEAEKLLRSDLATLSWTDRIRRWRLLAPLAICFYCLVLKGGILDGRAGFYYAFQRTLAELMLSLYLIDHDLRYVTASPRNQKQPLAGTSEHVLKD